jgi:hypothetical protein
MAKDAPQGSTLMGYARVNVIPSDPTDVQRPNLAHDAAELALLLSGQSWLIREGTNLFRMETRR